MNSKQLMQIGIEAAQAGGREILTVKKSGFRIKEKSGPHDLVTDADFASDKTIQEFLLKRTPDFGIQSEEGRNDATEYKWIVDPLDGTLAFAHNLDRYCVIVALVKGVEIQAGVVYHPPSETVYSAYRGGGAFKNGEKMTVDSSNTADSKRIVVRKSHSRPETWKRISKIPHNNDLHIRKTAGALEAVEIATGKFLAGVFYGGYVWDWAAPQIIIEEAGGRVTDEHGQIPRLDYSKGFYASNGKIHNVLMGAL